MHPLKCVDPVNGKAIILYLLKYGSNKKSPLSGNNCEPGSSRLSGL